MDRNSKFQLTEGAKYGGILDPQQCRVLAQKVMEVYDNNQDGVIENMEVRNMITDAYRSMNKDFKPTATDIVQYTRVITRRTDRSNITVDDIEKLCQRFFGATSALQKEKELSSPTYQTNQLLFSTKVSQK